MSFPPVPDLRTTIGSVTLPTPIMTASGTAGHGAELAAFMDLGTLGAVVVKSLAPFAWEGNPAVRVHQTPSGMINSVGLQGNGVAAWIEQDLPQLEASGARVVASIWGKTIGDYARAAEALSSTSDTVVAVEVNISCPNTEAGNELFAHNSTTTRAVLAATASAGRPRWAKLSPNVGTGLPGIAEAARLGGAEAVTVANTWFGLSIDPVTRRARLGSVSGPGSGGGVSGPAIHPLAVRAVHTVHTAHPDLPIIGAGGATCAEDVVEFLLVGASAVQIGTATLADPRACTRITTELADWCARQGVSRVAELIGAALL